MTVSSETSKVNLVGDGVTDTFIFTFEIYLKTDILVYVDDVLKTVDINYTVPAAGLYNPAGGTIVFEAADIPALDAIVTIILNIPFTQLTDYTEGDKFPAETHERGLDRAVRLLQQLRERIDRGLELSAYSTYSGLDLPDPVASQYLAWKDDLSGLKNVDVVTSGAITLTDYMKTLLDDEDASAAQTTLGMSAFIKTLLNDADAATAQATLGISSYVRPLLDDTTALQAIVSLDLEPYVRKQRATFTYNGGTTAYTVKAKTASYCCKDKYCWWDAELTTGAIGTPVASTRYYLYLDHSAITSGVEITATELIWASTAPAWNTTYGAWMNGDDLCIFAVITNGGPTNILEFFHSDEYVLYADEIEEMAPTDIDTTWTDVDMATSLPAFCTRANVTIYMEYVDDNNTCYWRTNGQTGATGHRVARINSVSQYTTNTIDVITDAAQIIELKHSASNGAKSGVYANGWYFPEGV